MNHGILTLTVTSPEQSFVEPLTLAEAKAYLNLPEYSPVDTEADSLLESMIQSAREVAEAYYGYDLVEKQYDLTLDSFPSCQVIKLRDNLLSVDVFRYTSSDGVDVPLVEGTDYIVDLRRGLVLPPVGASFTTAMLWPSSAVLVRYTVSRTTAPAHVLNGMKLLISGWFSNRLPYEAGLDEQPGAISLFSLGAKRNFR